MKKQSMANIIPTCSGQLREKTKQSCNRKGNLSRPNSNHIILSVVGLCSDAQVLLLKSHHALERWNTNAHNSIYLLPLKNIRFTSSFGKYTF